MRQAPRIEHGTQKWHNFENTRKKSSISNLPNLPVSPPTPSIHPSGPWWISRWCSTIGFHLSIPGGNHLWKCQRSTASPQFLIGCLQQNQEKVLRLETILPAIMRSGANVLSQDHKWVYVRASPRPWRSHARVATPTRHVANPCREIYGNGHSDPRKADKQKNNMFLMMQFCGWSGWRTFCSDGAEKMLKNAEVETIHVLV